MNDNFAQQDAQTPSPSTGSRQATHNVGSAMSSASRAAWLHAVRQAPSAALSWGEIVRGGAGSAALGGGLRGGRKRPKAGVAGERAVAVANGAGPPSHTASAFYYTA